MEKLKPCPKCNSKDIDENRYPECYYTACVDCGYSVESYVSRKECNEIWNTRAEEFRVYRVRKT